MMAEFLTAIDSMVTVLKSTDDVATLSTDYNFDGTRNRIKAKFCISLSTEFCLRSPLLSSVKYGYTWYIHP